MLRRESRGVKYIAPSNRHFATGETRRIEPHGEIFRNLNRLAQLDESTGVGAGCGPLLVMAVGAICFSVSLGSVGLLYLQVHVTVAGFAVVSSLVGLFLVMSGWQGYTMNRTAQSRFLALRQHGVLVWGNVTASEKMGRDTVITVSFVLANGKPTIGTYHTRKRRPPKVGQRVQVLYVNESLYALL